MRPAYPLLRSVFPIAVIGVCVAAFHFRAASANDNKENKKELKAQAEALLAKSYQLSNIEAPGSPAFVLNAKIHYQIGPQSAEGDGQIIWLAPDHYRVAYTAPNYSYTEIVRDGYRYLARTNDEMPLIIFELNNTVAKVVHENPNAPLKIKKVETVSTDPDALTCITFKWPIALRDCIDSAGDVVAADVSQPPHRRVLNAGYTFRDFAVYGVKRFPKQISFRGGDGHAIEIDVTQLAAIKDLPTDAFKIPIHSAVETWCSEPKVDVSDKATLVNPPEVFLEANQILRGSNAFLYATVRPSGRLRSAMVIYSSRPVKQKVLDDWVSNARFRSLLCGSNGIEYQTEISFVP